MSNELLSHITSSICDVCVTDRSLCDMCKDNPKYATVPTRSLFTSRIYHIKRSYTPVCPRGYLDCVCDPAYMKAYHPDSYKDLYGDIEPQEAVKFFCKKSVENDTYEELYCYESEDLTR